MANKHSNLASLFSDIAAAIREKTGDVGTIVADDFPDAIAAISGTGGGFWVDAGSVPSASSGRMLCARIPLADPDRLASMLGCALLFTDEAGNLSGVAPVIFALSPSKSLGQWEDYSATEGTVDFEEQGKISWTSATFEHEQSVAVVRYIAYGVEG